MVVSLLKTLSLSLTDLVIQAKSGTGKTLVFTMQALQMVETGNRKPQVRSFSVHKRSSKIAGDYSGADERDRDTGVRVLEACWLSLRKKLWIGDCVCAVGLCLSWACGLLCDNFPLEE